MSAYWKHNVKFSKDTLFPKLKNRVRSINDLSSGMLQNSINIGRSWKASDLRLKSDADLHKLWYVLLKEKLALRADVYRLAQNTQTNKKLEMCELKVADSMKRLKSVINERATLRNEFLMFLEFWYIRKKQMNPDYKICVEEAVVKPEKKHKKPVTPVVENVKTEKSKVVIKGALEHDKKEEVPVSNTPELKENEITVLNEQEIKQVEKLKKTYTSMNSILDDYVEQRNLLRGKEKRRVVTKINVNRARQAKNIFMKEMTALSYKLKNMKSAKNPEISKLENIS